MKVIYTVVLAGLASLLLTVAFVHVRAEGTIPYIASSSSQIYIHGTPVCVTQMGKDIVAQVGECGVAVFPPDSGVREGSPFHGGPGITLPPGHPPIDREMFPEANRRVLI